MKDLQELMHATAGQAPTVGVDLDAVVAQGRTRVRRRRTAAVAGTAAAAALVAGSLAVSGILGATGGRISPAGGTEPVGPVVGFADAKPAAEGKDYTVLSTYTNENLDRDNGRYFQGVTPDGLVVVQDGPRLKDPTYRLGLLDPQSGSTDWLTAPTKGMDGTDPVRLAGASSRWLVWQTMSGQGGRSFLTIDRRTGEQATLDIAAARLGLDRTGSPDVGGAVLGSDDRIYFTAASETESADASALWSVPATDASGLRHEGVVGSFDVDGDLLTYTDHTDRPSSIVHVRDLRTGEERTFDARSGSRCNLLGLDRAGDVIALHQFCGEHDAVRDDRLQLVTGSGEPIVTFRGDGLEGGALTDRYATFAGYGERTGGAYVYDLRSGDLLRVAEDDVRFGPTLLGEGNLLTWASPVNGGHGMELRVGRFG